MITAIESSREGRADLWCGLFLKRNVPPYSHLDYSLYYYVEVFFRGGRKFISHPLGRKLPTSPEAQRHPVDKFLMVLLQLLHVGIRHTRILADGVDHPVVAVLDGDGDEALLFQRADVRADLAFTDVKKFRKVAVRGEAAILVIERVDFNEQDFFHKRKLPGQPDVFRNPHPLKITR